MLSRRGHEVAGNSLETKKATHATDFQARQLKFPQRETRSRTSQTSMLDSFSPRKDSSLWFYRVIRSSWIVNALFLGASRLWWHVKSGAAFSYFLVSGSAKTWVEFSRTRSDRRLQKSNDEWMRPQSQYQYHHLLNRWIFIACACIASRY